MNAARKEYAVAKNSGWSVFSIPITLCKTVAKLETMFLVKEDLPWRHVYLP